MSDFFTAIIGHVVLYSSAFDFTINMYFTKRFYLQSKSLCMNQTMLFINFGIYELFSWPFEGLFMLNASVFMNQKCCSLEGSNQNVPIFDIICLF